MTTSPAQVIQALLANPRDLANVKRVTTPDVTYVSLNEDNPELKRYLPWTGTNKGPKPSSAPSKELSGRGRPRPSRSARSSNRAIRSRCSARSRIAGQSGQEITSPFSLLAKVRDGKIHYVQFLEDTFGTSGTLGRPRS